MDQLLEEVKLHKHICFGIDNYVTLGVVRSLGEAGIMPTVILHKHNPIHLVIHSKYAKDITVVDSLEEGLEIILKRFGDESLKPFIHSSDDWVESFLDEHFELLKDKFLFYDGGRQGIITENMNKDAINKVAESCGCNVPKSEVVKRGVLPTTLKYPVITKGIMSIKGGWKKDVIICQNEKELLDAFETIQSETILICEYIEKKNELCLDGFCINHGKDVCIPFETSYLTLINGQYGNYMRMTPFKREEVKQQVQKVLEKTGFNGVFSVEFLIDQNDKLWFLEVNFRFATWGYAFQYGGVNLPVEWAKATLGGAILHDELSPRITPFTAMVEPMEFRLFVMSGKMKFSEWFKNWKNTDCYFFANKKDPWPFYYIFINGFKDILNKIFKRNK